MRTRETSILAVALGQLRYRLALAVIGFGVCFGWFIACLIGLAVVASYFDDGRELSQPVRWSIIVALIAVVAGLTYYCRGWIVRKAVEDAPPQPVQPWTARDITDAGLTALQLMVSALALMAGLIVAAVAAYGGYLLLTTLSLPAAILIGAIIIAVAILVAASA